MPTILSLTLPGSTPERGVSCWIAEYRRAIAAAAEAENRLRDLDNLIQLRERYVRG